MYIYICIHMYIYVYICIYTDVLDELPSSLLKQQEELMDHLARHRDTSLYDGFPTT